MKKKLLSITYILIFLIVSYCKQTESKSKSIANFTLDDFYSMVKMVDNGYIDTKINKSRAYQSAAYFALNSLPHSLYMYPESYFNEREKYEEKEDLLPGSTFKISPKDKFVIFDPDYIKIKEERKLKEKEPQRQKLSEEEIQKLIEREKTRKNILTQKWDNTQFKKSDFERVIQFALANLDKYKENPFIDKKESETEESREPFSSKYIFLAAANGYLASLDPHSNIFEKEEWEESIRTINDSSFEGIGARLSGGGNTETVVENPIEKMPAVKAGVRAGDVIVSVDGVDIKGESLDKVVARIKGKKGTKVKLVLKRKGVQNNIVLEIVRDKITIKNLSSELLSEKSDIGYIKLTGFIKTEDEPVLDGIKQQLADLEKKSKEKGSGLKALILDLRNNAGGYLDLAIDVADLFIKKGLIVTTKSPGASPDDAYARNDDITNLPLVVLINSRSASASEIVASALQYHGRGLILGERSFGKATVQKLMGLNGNPNYLLKLTQSRYYSPSGKTIQVVGVTPDILISAEKDGSFPYRYREEDMWNHLPEITSTENNFKSRFNVDGLEAWVKKNGKSEAYFKEHENDAITPDYQLIRSLDYIEALTNLKK